MDLVTLQNSLDNLSFAVLLVTMLLYWSGIAFPKIPYLATLGTAGMAIANLSIASLLGARWIEAGYFPLSNLYESLFFIAWGLTATHLLAEYLSRSRWVGAVTSPVAMGITAFAALSLPGEMQVAEPLVPALQSNWLMMHVSVMLLSYACLMVGSLLAIAFLIVTRGQAVTLTGSSYGNSNRRQTPLNKLQTVSDIPSVQFTSNGSSGNIATPTLERISLETTPTWSPETLSLAQILDNISYRMIGLGFPLLTIGIIAGGVWANEAWGSYWSWDPKETWALITWLVFAAYLHARITKGWQGRRPAILAAAGFCVVWVCYMGVNLLGKGLHSYGWFF
ncbi:c-type cytochrome biogenesis protein CcsB [Roseofilum sp. BLCC_M154]|uniref:Cytochrome c biogenesis protein CcsA n=1 Tax=Roseofilum acuticapitatum BLCC-M154 TaxID=3022444 RepID=A0ABT7AYR6_9CYAN|nr:c-type cytochrome biogenesis protein CcsB [Roseofilum acuticapitatum]MDJ1172048.1 c-type cytochrome biogenesis protein CcsB [Roseofilum acuticapitatum BLCC-M154]